VNDRHDGTVGEPEVLVERDGSLLRLTLNRPSSGNAITLSMARQLMLAATVAETDPSVRCVLLTASGKYFCVGGAIDEFASTSELSAHLREITTYLHAAITRLLKMEKPLVTAINGPAAGGGLGLALLGDVAIAARSAHFTTAYSAIGLTPDGGLTWLLPRLIGLRRAQEMLICNKRVDAEEAALIGLVSRTVSDDMLASEAAEQALALARSATGALGQTRKLLLSSFETSPETQMELESGAIALSATSLHGQGGIAAFLSKRKPEYR